MVFLLIIYKYFRTVGFHHPHASHSTYRYFFYLTCPTHAYLISKHLKKLVIGNAFPHTHVPQLLYTESFFNILALEMYLLLLHFLLIIYKWFCHVGFHINRSIEAVCTWIYNFSIQVAHTSTHETI